ncbi:site-specific integrase [uncultured Aquabacterium sp.]|jgi:integrase|uniref:site-specific integrase n=1 Tax=uncultured Aquabacterium sp. TaxID=158753 RepID=UPI00261A84CF|nr:site-specific integrase [uncultured Aquabacterium sp.]
MAITDKDMQRKPTDKDQWIADDWGRGDGRFLGRITPSGRRCFYFRYTLPDGKRDTLAIGDYSKDGKGGLTVADARAVALGWSKLYKDTAVRKNLRAYFEEQRKAEEAARLERERVAAEEAAQREREASEAARRMTVNRLFERWQSIELLPRKNRAGKSEGRKDGGQQIKWRFDLHVFPEIGGKLAEEVRRADVMAILDRLSSEGKSRTHNLVLTELRQMYKFAQVRELVAHDPTAGIKRKDEGERKRWLTPEELRQLHDALPHCGLNLRTQLAVSIQLSTACRIGELAKAKWSDVDMDGRVWRIPAENSKNGKPHLVHLSSFAMRHIEQLHALKEADTPYLFPTFEGSVKKGNRVCKGHTLPTSINKQLADRQRASESTRTRRTPHTTALALPGGAWSTHDLRRTAATLMSRLNIRIEVIHKCLNHSLDDELATIYIQDDMMDERRNAFEALGSRLDSIMSGQTATNVVPMKSVA